MRAKSRSLIVRPSQLIVLLTCLATSAALLFPSVAMATEEPAFTIERKDGDIEIRRYAPLLIAEVVVSGERGAAANQGFRLLADFIFGNNSARQKIDMTAPVTQQPGDKIAITAPVTQQPVGDSWKVRFMMPAQYTAETLPVPNDKRVTIISQAAKRFAVIRFSGWSSEDNLSEHKAELEAWVKASGLVAAAAPTVAFYNPPWSLPFLRRNEFLIELAG